MPAWATCSDADARSAGTRAWLEHAFAAGLYAALAVVVTWPLAARMSTELPRGNLSNGALPLFNVWTLAWNADRLHHGYADYWHAPIFFPETHAFAFSESHGLTGVLFALLAPALGQVAAYNAIVLLFLTLNGLAARRLVRVGGVASLSATCIGALTVMLPFALKELGVLQLLALFPILLALAELCRLFSTPSGAALVRLSLWFAVALWTCAYYALFLTLFSALAACVLLKHWLSGAAPAFRGGASWLQRPLLLGAAVALVIATAAAAPIVLGQRAAIARYQRSDASIAQGSAQLRSYVTLLPRTLVGRTRVLPRHGRSLYPGLVLLALAIAGLLGGMRGPQRHWLLFCAACAGLAALFSFGTRLQLFGIHPYALTLQRYWPGFSQLRSPYRLAAFAQMFLLPPAGYGVQQLLRSRFARGDRWRERALAIGVVALAFVEVVPLGQKLAPFPAAAMREPWVDWLATHPDGAVAMVPPEQSGKLQAFEPIVVAMLQGLQHGHALLNGYSGFFPRNTARMNRALRAFPDSTSVQALRRARVRFVVADRAWLAGKDAERSLRKLGGAAPRAVHQDATRVVYALDAP